MKLNKLIMCFIAASLSATTASADYLKGQLGYNLTGEVDGDGGSGIDLESEFASPFAFSYGKVINPKMAVEFELQRYSNEVEGALGLVDLNLLGLGVNLVFTPGQTEQGASPYYGVGIALGVAEVDAPGLDTDSENGINLNLLGGILMPVNEKFSIGGEARYSFTVSDYDGADISYFSIGFVGKFEI